MTGMELPEKRNQINIQAAREHRNLNSRLDIILADMLSSALVWEQKHNRPQSRNSEHLTNSYETNILPPRKNTPKGEDNNDNHNEQQRTNNF